MHRAAALLPLILLSPIVQAGSIAHSDAAGDQWTTIQDRPVPPTQYQSTGFHNPGCEDPTSDALGYSLTADATTLHATFTVVDPLASTTCRGVDIGRPTWMNTFVYAYTGEGSTNMVIVGVRMTNTLYGERFETCVGFNPMDGSGVALACTARASNRIYGDGHEWSLNVPLAGTYEKLDGTPVEYDMHGHFWGVGAGSASGHALTNAPAPASELWFTDDLAFDSIAI
ncbi:MAG: hypothetical protein WDA16_04495 [Candidatus Thermoplasmatota archaeon]